MPWFEDLADGSWRPACLVKDRPADEALHGFPWTSSGWKPSGTGLDPLIFAAWEAGAGRAKPLIRAMDGGPDFPIRLAVALCEPLAEETQSSIPPCVCVKVDALWENVLAKRLSWELERLSARQLRSELDSVRGGKRPEPSAPRI